MFCGKCGKEMKRNAKFCPHCGAENLNASRVGGPAAPSERPGAAATAQAITPKFSNRTVGMAAVAAIAVVVIILISLLVGGRSAKSTVGKFVDAVTTPDSAQLIELLPRGFTITNKEEVITKLNSQFESAWSGFDKYLGEPVKFTYEITSFNEIDGSKLESIQRQYITATNNQVKVKEAQYAKVELTAAGTLRTETVSFRLPLVKVGGSWALDYVSMGGRVDLSFLKSFF